MFFVSLCCVSVTFKFSILDKLSHSPVNTHKKHLQTRLVTNMAHDVCELPAERKKGRRARKTIDALSHASGGESPEIKQHVQR